MRVDLKRCLVRVQKGVSKRLKGHLLHINWALIQRQKRVDQKTVVILLLQKYKAVIISSDRN